MRAWSPLILAVAFLAPCDTNAQPGGPLAAAVKFFEVRQVSNCAKLWPMYSAGTQEKIRVEEHRRQRERSGFPQPEKPEEQQCGWTGGILKAGSARITRQQGNEASVTAELVVKAPRSRYDMYPPTAVVPEVIQLVQERGAWRVVLPVVKTRERGPDERLTEVGPVDVFYHPSFTPRIEATVVVRAKRDALFAALRDATFWARALPSIKTVQPLVSEGEVERVELSFAGVGHSLALAARSTRKLDSNAEQAAVIWDAEGGSYAPVYFRGSWRLQPYEDGTRITLLLVFDRKQWPADAAEGIFSAERMARAVLDLEKAALK